MGDKKSQPFASLGKALKKLRESRAKSSAELSGAVEIDNRKLNEFETGVSRPSEDILQLIIQHFALSDEEATELWRLAGYEQESLSDTDYVFNDDNGEAVRTKTVMITSQDARIVYTDMVQVMVNNYGVIVNFMQGAGVNNQPLAVARVGMSKEHAISVIQVLQKTLEQSDDLNNGNQHPKRLSAGSQK